MAEHNPIVADEYLLPTNFVSVECPNWINQNQMMDGNGIVSLPLMLQSEGMNNFVSMANFGSQPVDDSNTVKEFSGGNSYPINGAQIHNDFRAAYLLAARNGGYDNNPEKFAALPYSTNISYSNDVFYPSSQELGVFPVDLSRKCNEITGTVIGRATGTQPFPLLSGGNNMISPGVWFSAERPSSSSNNSPSGSSRFSNELSLSLTTTPSPCIQDQFSELSCSGVTTNPFREQAQAPKNLSLNFDSYKPLQLSQFLSGSRYLAVMQDILSQIAKYSLENLNIVCYDDGEHSPFSSSCSYGPHTSINRVDAQTKRKHLLALLQAVDDRYSQCLDELHMVVSAFHAVTELHPSIHTHFALQTVSFLYKKLRERISTFILAMGEHSSLSNRSARAENSSFEASFIQKQWTLQQLRKKDHQLWRPQRGLPERSVSVLRAWMFQNFLHPYPKDTEKHLLAVKSGLTRSQVSNWFINARVRLWKPMIEEMYAEMNRRNHQQNEEDEEEEMNNGCRNRRVLA